MNYDLKECNVMLSGNVIIDGVEFYSPTTMWESRGSGHLASHVYSMIRRDLKRFFSCLMMRINDPPSEHIKLRYVRDTKERRNLKRGGVEDGEGQAGGQPKQVKMSTHIQDVEMKASHHAKEDDVRRTIEQDGRLARRAETEERRPKRQSSLDGVQAESSFKPSRLAVAEAKASRRRAANLSNAIAKMQSDSDHYVDAQNLVHKESEMYKQMSACKLE